MDGRTWLGAADLLTAARAARRPDGGVARVIPGADPAGAVAALLAAQLDGAVPVIAGPGQDGAAAVRAMAGHRSDLPDQPLLVALTSGSTSTPRAVLRTVASWADSFGAFSAVTGIVPGDVVWAPGGLSSTLTLFATWHALAAGVPVLAGGRWRGVAAAGPVAASATVLQSVPAVLSDVLEARDAGLLPRLRTAVVAGAATSAGVRRRAARAGIQLVEYYGAAELSFVAVDPDGCGLTAFPGAALEVRRGVIWARSPYTCLGYLGRQPDNSGAFRRDDHGWCTVGDRGRLDAQGRLTVSGRGGEAASVGGQVIQLAEVESLLGDVPGVAELVCLAEPHARLGQRVVAAVRPLDGLDPVPQLRALARRELPAAARPVRYVMVSALPRTAGGKVARAVLRGQVTRAGRRARTMS